MPEALKAFHGEQALKDATIARMREHREQDRLMQGRYWRDDPDYPVYRGCAIGCLVAEDIYRERWGMRGPSPFHPFRTVEPHEMREAFPHLVGLPEEFAILYESIFEGLPHDEAVLWTEQVLDAIPVGVDLTEWARDYDREPEDSWGESRDRVLVELRAMTPVVPEPVADPEPVMVTRTEHALVP